MPLTRLIWANLVFWLALVPAAALASPPRFPWSLLPPLPEGDFTTLADRKAGISLERCALGLDPHPPTVTRDCVRVLTLLASDKPGLHRRLRKVLRASVAPGAKTEAAAALAATAERDNIDLMILELLENRDNREITPHLLEAYLAVQPPWVIYYLRLLAIEAPDPLARSLAAERALSLGHLQARSLPPLIEALANTPADSADAERLQAWASRIGSSCDLAAIRRALDARSSAADTRDTSPSGSTHPAPVDALRLGSVCRAALSPPPRPRPTLSACLTTPLPTLEPALVRAAALACQGADPRSFYQHTALARRFVPMRIARSERGATLGDDRGSPWRRRPTTAPTRTRPLAPDTLDPTHFPPDFWGFDPRLEQPPWYPRYLHLTIDDGPRPGVLEPTLDVLDRHGVKATFFFVGSAMIRRHLEDPDELRAQLRRVIASGHLIAYHSMNHDLLPDYHESGRDPDQFTDAVTLFRYLVSRFAGHPVAIVHGLFPGGRGAFLEQMPRLYAAAGLHQHVFWNHGPGFWVHTTSIGEVRKQACTLVTAPEPMTVLLHEFPMLPRHFEALFDTIKTRCPADRVPTIAETRTLWRKDHAFAPTLCDADPHPDLVGLCQRGSGGDRTRRTDGRVGSAEPADAPELDTP